MSKLKTINDESELLQQLRLGNKAAFEQFYDRKFFSVFYYACRFLPDVQAAEDASTESFLKLWERMAEFESLEKMSAFLLVTVRNTCLKQLRSSQRENKRYKELYNLLESNDPQALNQQELTAEIYKHIHEEVEKLTPQLKKVFYLSYIQGLSNEEIASQLGIANQSVRNDKYRAVKQIRLALAGKDILPLFLWWMLFRGRS